MNVIGALVKQTSESSSPCEGSLRRQRPMNKKGFSPEITSVGALILDFSGSRTMRNTFLLFISHLGGGCGILL